MDVCKYIFKAGSRLLSPTLSLLPTLLLLLLAAPALTMAALLARMLPQRLLNVLPASAHIAAKLLQQAAKPYLFAQVSSM